ncbi:cbb3-type cytochrome oxidase assembly protein CcoS [Helicobacter sp. MIT 00-7814]|uniref:NAD(P)-binding domain-containing protein n=1 Tax=unclassified Helicobacter TaxID=2593540 RepID=UPI000E1E66EB|nr:MULTISPECIES: NAD(P)-binding domain-containing protein [unclassified Helicobacter]RDU55532.1 cbb3-type cytochrome oxidase assembly protein CcoS [Helicobacter sp. MIT 99-10781]RDU55622.1 cbb3-type cytochrome oxidase assembly protein CcoS [Helicobacter sp. MIT 00-7814]
MSEIYDIAIIGGGPGGIASAVESITLGIKKLIMFEKGENHSATIRQFYKDGKRVDKDYKGQKVELNGNIYFVDGTKESTLDLFDELLKTKQIDVRFKSEIESVRKEGEIFIVHTSGGQSFKARFVIIAIGKMGQPNKPSYQIPSSIRKKVQYNANNIESGEKVLIVGGGNSAVEYANFLCQSNDATLNYRRSEFSRINEVNNEQLQDSIQSGKLKTRLGIDINALEDSEGKVKVCFTDGTSEVFDRVVYAIGGAAPVDFLKKCNLELDENGVPVATNHESSIKNLFIAGDILFKSGGSIAAALNHGYEIVLEIKKRLDSIQ